MMNGWDMTGWGWGWMTFGTLLVIAVIALLISAVVRTPASSRFPPVQDSALAVLRRRYAAGEIDEAEFDRRRAALERSSRETAE